MTVNTMAPTTIASKLPGVISSTARMLKAKYFCSLTEVNGVPNPF